MLSPFQILKEATDQLGVMLAKAGLNIPAAERRCIRGVKGELAVSKGVIQDFRPSAGSTGMYTFLYTPYL